MFGIIGSNKPPSQLNQIYSVRVRVVEELLNLVSKTAASKTVVVEFSSSSVSRV